MMDQMAAEPAIAIPEGVDVDECEYRRRYERIKLQRKLLVERDYAFDKPGLVLRSSADVHRDRHTRFAITFPDKATLTSHSGTDEADIIDDNALRAQQFVRIDGLLAGPADRPDLPLSAVRG